MAAINVARKPRLEALAVPALQVPLPYALLTKNARVEGKKRDLLGATVPRTRPSVVPGARHATALLAVTPPEVAERARAPASTFALGPIRRPA